MKGKAIIIGGSIAGLFAGNLLQRQGWQVDIYERVADPLASRGAGIATHDELMQVLRRAGVGSEETVGVQVNTRVVLGRDGTVHGEYEYPQVLTSWGRIYEMLLAKFPVAHYHQGKSLVGIDQEVDGPGAKADNPKERNTSGVVARFEDGTQAQADVLIGADGSRSTVRTLLMPEVKPLYAGYVAWRGVAEEAALSAVTHASLFGRFSFGLPDGEQLIGYPIAGEGNSTLAGKQRYNIVWYRPADEQTDLVNLLTDAQGRVHEAGIPPPLIRPEVIDRLRADAHALLAPQFAEVLDRTVRPFFQPIYDLESPHLAIGRVALIGDAAYVARPHCGMGVTKAGSDAAELVDALSAVDTGYSAALKTFERSRARVGMAMVARARHLGAYMQAKRRTQEEREMAERYRTPEAVMRETAVAFPI